MVQVAGWCRWPCERLKVVEEEVEYVQQGSDTCKVRHSRLPARAGWCRWPCERLEVVEEEVKYVQQGSDTCNECWQWLCMLTVTTV